MASRESTEQEDERPESNSFYSTDVERFQVPTRSRDAESRKPAYRHNTDSGSRHHDQDLQSTSGTNKKEKDEKKKKSDGSGFFNQLTVKGKKLVNSFLANFQSDGKVEITDSNITIQAIANIKAMAGNESLKCSRPYVQQPREPTSLYVNGITLDWSLPNPQYSTLEAISICIRDDREKVVEKLLKSNACCYRVPDYTLLCGKKYNVQVVTHIKHCDNSSQEVPSDVDFFTRPGRPSDIRVQCSDNHFDVTWLPCEGAESYVIDIHDNIVVLAHQSVDGGFQKCRFDIDAQSKILFGRRYSVTITSVLKDWKNSATNECYFGSDSCPKSVHATPVDGTNKVLLKWKKPHFTFFSSYSYAVEAVGEGNETLPRQITKETEMEINDLKGGMTYFFRVATHDQHGYSLWSTSNKVRTEACAIQVEGFRLETNNENSANALDCFWDSAPGAISYQIQYTSHNRKKTILVDITSGMQQHAIQGLPPNTEYYAIQGLTPNTEYYATIKAQDSRGYGTPCGEKSKLTGFSLPKDIRLEKTDGLLIVRFTAAELATSHRVILRNEDGDEISKDATQENKCSFADWEYNKKYTATVTAMYGKDEGGVVTSEEFMTEPDTISLTRIHVEAKESDASLHGLRSVFVISTQVDQNCTDYKAWICCKDFTDESYVMKMDVDEEEKRAVKQYNCFHEGAKYGVKVKCKNQGGWSAWSGENLVVTVPKVIENVELHLDDDGLIAEWDDVPHATNNVLEFFVGDDSFKKDKKEHSPYRLKKKLEHGVEIYYKIYPVNTAGNGRITTSNTCLLPLDPPSSPDMKDRTEKVLFTWTKSEGMKKARILFINSELQEISHITGENSWLSPPVVLGESYEFQIWARNGSVESKKYLSRMFITAPSAVEVERNKLSPETSLNVNIISKHAGPFQLTWRESNGEENDVCVFEPTFTIEGLKPATNYDVSARCLYGENNSNESAVCHATTLMTLPGQVTGVQCKDLKNSLKRLEWVGCGNQAVTYTVAGKRNYVALEKIETKNTFLELQDLNAGKYQFFVTAGSGRSSEPFSLIVPETPAYKFDAVTPKCVSVICTSVLKANKYEAELWNENSFLHLYESTKGEFWMEYDFEPGKEYFLIIYACCNGYRSEGAMHYFYADLPAPTDLCRTLDKKQPSKKVCFTWKTNELAKKTHLKLFGTNGNVVGEMITVEKEWEIGDLMPNKKYILKAYSNDGVRSYANYAEVKFYTAPSKPDKLEIKKNLAHPTTKFDVEIQADYNGPFMILVKKADEEKGEEIEKDSKRFILDNMISGCPYYFFARCKFTDPVNKIVYYSAYTPFTGKK